MGWWSRVVYKFACAFKGLGTAFRADNSFKFHFAVAVAVILMAWLCGVDNTEWALLLFSVGLVVVSELFNTAIEFLVRMFTTEYHELAEKLLNIAAGAVLFATLTAIVTGGLILGPRLWLRVAGWLGSAGSGA